MDKTIKKQEHKKIKMTSETNSQTLTYSINTSLSTFNPNIVFTRSDGKNFAFDIINEYRGYSRPSSNLYISNEGDVGLIETNRIVVYPEGIDGPAYRKISQFEFDRYNHGLSEEKRINDNYKIYNSIMNSD